MVSSKCKYCNKKIKRAGYYSGIFCSVKCKSEWQTTKKPVTKEWLYQKYFIEKLSAYEIAKIVKRNPKNVWRWLTDYGFKLRGNNKNIITDKRFSDKNWLYTEYITNKKSASEIASEFNITNSAIYYWLSFHKIKSRSISDTRKIKHWALAGEKNGMYGRRGSLSPNWLGGITPERQYFYQLDEWKKSCSFIWKRDDATCQRCGRRNYKSKGEFAIHHKVSFAIKELRSDPRNLILVCNSCHHWIHSKKNINKNFILTYEQFKQLYQ